MDDQCDNALLEPSSSVTLTPRIPTPEVDTDDDVTDACVSVDFPSSSGYSDYTTKPVKPNTLLGAPLRTQPFNASPSTPEPSSTGPSSILSSWYSSASTNTDTLGYDSKTYRSYVASIDKCLKNFEYSIEWPDLIAALTKLNKVIASFNVTLQTSVTCTTPPPLPRSQLITKRLSQTLHPNLPSGVHLKTLETFDLIFQGFKIHDYVNLENDLFSFVSGLLPLWSYAAISVKPKLLSIYETHLAALKSRLRPALPGILLSLFNGLVDDGVEQDIKIRITSLLCTLQSDNATYLDVINDLACTAPSIHLPLITHISSISYTPPPNILMRFINSPNTLVQRNALEILKTYDMNSLPLQTQVNVTKSALLSLLKRDISITRRVYTVVETTPELLVPAINELINECVDGLALTRVLSTLLDNTNINILEEILPTTVRYLMKCEYTVAVSFLSTLKPSFLSDHFVSYLFSYDESIENLESRVIVFNYVVKLRLFEFDYESLFSKLIDLPDTHVRVILQMVRLHYTEHHDSFVRFYNSYMCKYFDINQFEELSYSTDNLYAVKREIPSFNTNFTSPCFEFVCELICKSNPDELAFKYIVLSACTSSEYTSSCIRTYLKFQTECVNYVYNTHAVYLMFKHCYEHNKSMLNELRYPEKYLLSELHSDENLKTVINLDLTNRPLVVLKLIDPGTMNTPYRRFITESFVQSSSNLVLNSILKYLEFNVDKPVNLERARSDSNVYEQFDSVKSSNSVVQLNVAVVDSPSTQSICSYDHARVYTLLDKLEFVIQTQEAFLRTIDLTVLLSKLTILSTIQNSNSDVSTTLNIQTRALKLIYEIVKSHGDMSHSFVYDSLLTHLNNTEVCDENSLLWEIHAIPVIREFLRFDLENYTLALVVQKCLNSHGSVVHERAHTGWLTAISSNLPDIRKHLNAVALITYTCVCKNLSFTISDNYSTECIDYLRKLLTHVFAGKEPVSFVNPTGFFGSIFGNSVIKQECIDDREALRIALLGKLDNLVKIGCNKHTPELIQLLSFIASNHEVHLINAITRCFDSNGIEMLVKDLCIPSSKIASACEKDRTLECVNFLTKYSRFDKTLETHSIVSLSKHCDSNNAILRLITSYLKNHGKVNKELQDLVIRVLEHAIESREFGVLENNVPMLFDLVWGADVGDNNTHASASNASVRDQKIIVNLVHSLVVAVLVAVKGSATPNTESPSNYVSALRVLEQISHHSYLRKAWKKEIFDLITNEPTFFYFTPDCLAIWKVIVDNLFTQDRSTFSELITRLTQTTQMSTTAFSNIFSSKETEVYETRANLLKRLAFVIHSSEKDQYAKHITNIQEKIAEALKIGASSSGVFNPTGLAPQVNSSVFLCFRVMVAKFNSNILVSLWPIIVHEVVMVLNNLQNTLDDESIEPSEILLNLYVQTLKLLNTLFSLNSSDSQLAVWGSYKWAFLNVPETSSSETNNNVCNFIPYISKLQNSARTRYKSMNFNGSPLNTRNVANLEELCKVLGNLDIPVPESESEILDFCDCSETTRFSTNL